MIKYLKIQQRPTVKPNSSQGNFQRKSADDGDRKLGNIHALVGWTERIMAWQINIQLTMSLRLLFHYVWPLEGSVQQAVSILSWALHKIRHSISKFWPVLGRSKNWISFHGLCYILPASLPLSPPSCLSHWPWLCLSFSLFLPECPGP